MCLRNKRQNVDVYSAHGMKRRLLFRGSATSLLTPFKKDGTVDEATLRDLVDLQLKHRVEALAPTGGTGEVAALSENELTLVLETVVEEVDKRVPVIGGIGADTTLKAIVRAKEAKSCGLDAIMVPPPSSGRTTQEGLYQHYCSIADAVELPMVIDNVSASCGTALEAGTVLRLAHEVPFLSGVIEEDLGKAMGILSERPAGFGVWAGSDMLVLSFLALGADGAVSVVSNEAPRRFSDLVRFSLKGMDEKAREMHYSLLPLMYANGLEPNPVPVKAALAMMGVIEENVRLPLVTLSEHLRPQLEKVLRDARLLPAE